MKVQIAAGHVVECTENEWHCLCGAEGCTVYRGERLTVAERKYFPGLGPMLQFAEKRTHSDDDNPPWYPANAFKVRYDA